MSEGTTTTNRQISKTASHNNPYVGPRTFQVEQADRFFGREREARELLAIVGTERLTLFYAQSGAGKSSLLNTRLIPGLQSKGFEVLPVGRVGSTGIASAASNPFVINLVHSLLSASINPAQVAELSLTDFLTCLVYGEQGYALLESPPPTLSQGGGAPIPRVLIIDQFEEILTTQITAWAQRGAFFAQLAAAMQADPYLWVILTLREDYVAGLDPYAHYFPGGFRSRYYMQRMGRWAALEAVQRPAAGIGQRPFAPGVAEQLVDNLRLVQNSWSNEPATKLIQGEFVEPVQLQVVCYQLWERLQEEQKLGLQESEEPRNSDQPVEKNVPSGPITPQYITESDLKRLAGQRELVAFVNQALADYYEQGIAKVLQLPAITLNERAVRDWFSTKLITPEETRGLVNHGEEESGGLPTAVVNLLADLFLIRAENRAGGVWYELVHDRFIQPILEANRTWLLAQSNPLTAVTRIWVTSNRDPERLLRGTQLADAQEYARTHPDWVGQDEKEFLAASIRRESEAKTRQQRAIIITTLIVTLLAGIVYWGWRSAVEAIRQRSSALAAQNYAEIQLARARAGELAAQSESVLASFPQRSLLLAIEAVSATQAITVRVPAAEEALRQALAVVDTPPLGSHRAPISAMTTSPDNHWLVTASDDGIALVWDLQSTEPASHPITLRGHEGGITAVAISPDNHWLVTASDDGTARLWDLQAPDPAASPIVLRGHAGGISTVAISSDNHWFVTASIDKSIRLWNLHINELLDKACKTTARNLNHAEWAQYFPNASYRRTCPEFPIHFSVIEEKLARSNDLARSGNITGALNLYQQVLNLEPTLQVTPTIKVASMLADYAAELARSGEITDAVTSYQQALRLDPTLSITPVVEANRQYAHIVVDQAAELARSGEITVAVTSYQQALLLDPTLSITPVVEANRQYAHIVVDQAAELARSGEITTAVQSYQEALRLDPTLPITPEVEANHQYAPVVVEQANDLARSGEITAAVQSYQEALHLDPTLPITPEVEANRQALSTVLTMVAERGVRITDTQVITVPLQQSIQLANTLDDNALRLAICQNSQIGTVTPLVRPVCRQAFTSAKALTETMLVSDTVDSLTGELWKLSITASSRITITLSKAPDSQLDPYLTLYDAKGQRIAEHDDIVQGEIQDSAINNQVLTKPGDYFIQASRCCPNNDQGSRGAYILEVIVKPDE